MSSTNTELDMHGIMSTIMSDGTICPSCGEEAQEGRSFEYKTEGMTETGTCSECGVTWQAVLGYQRIANAVNSDKVPFKLPSKAFGSSPLRSPSGNIVNRNRLRMDVLSDMRLIVGYFKNPGQSPNPRAIAEAAARLDRILPEG